MIFKKGLYIQLTNRSTNRVILSAATDELDKKTFDEIWKAVGDNIYNATKPEKVHYYEIQVSPLLTENY